MSWRIELLISFSPSPSADALIFCSTNSAVTSFVAGRTSKPNSDDPRESLSYKLKKCLEFESKAVLCHDPYVADPNLVSLEKIHKEADIVVLATPHSDYAKENWEGKKIIDVWNFYAKGESV